MADDDVQLTDLQVIQRYSLAVRGASASRTDLVAALQADLDWLKGKTPAKTPAKAPAKTPAKTPAETSAKAPAKAAKRSTPAKRLAKE